MQQLGTALREQEWARDVTVVATARVPIVTVVDRESGVSADVSLCGDGIHTTQFLRGCVRDCASFVPVVLALKTLLAQHALNKAFTGGVSSYRLCVMVQACALGLVEAMDGVRKPLGGRGIVGDRRSGLGQERGQGHAVPWRPARKPRTA